MTKNITHNALKRFMKTTGAPSGANWCAANWQYTNCKLLIIKTKQGLEKTGARFSGI
jgi:hypothetical protein